MADGSGVAAPMLPTPASPARKASSRKLSARSLQQIVLQVLSIVVCVLVWHVLASHRVNLGLITFANVPPPLEVLHAAWDLFTSPKLIFHLRSSLYRIVIGFFIAVLFGVGLGLVIGRFRWAQQLVLPPLEMLRPIPAVAWIPLAILMFPSSEASMIFITFIGALFPILLNTIHGVEQVDARLIASARSLGTRELALFGEVILPSAAPAIVTGLSIGMGTCWFCLVTAEMISGQFGIGYYTWESYTLQNYANIIVGMLLIGALGMGSSVLIRQVGVWLMPWDHGKREGSKA